MEDCRIQKNKKLTNSLILMNKHLTIPQKMMMLLRVTLPSLSVAVMMRVLKVKKK